MSDLDPSNLANEYVTLAKKIEQCEERQTLIKDNLKALLPCPFTEDDTIPAQYHPWRFGLAQVMWVKGRHTEKVDTKKLRKVLVLAGVDIAIIDGAFETATTKTTGDPSLRISSIIEGQGDTDA